MIDSESYDPWTKVQVVQESEATGHSEYPAGLQDAKI